MLAGVGFSLPLRFVLQWTQKDSSYLLTKPLYCCRVACGISTSSSKLRHPFLKVQPSAFNFSVICSLDMFWLLYPFPDFLSLLFVCHGPDTSRSNDLLPKCHLWCARAEMVLRLPQAPWEEHSLPWSRSSLIACLSHGHWFPCYEKLNIFTGLLLSFCGGAIKKQQIAFFWVKPVNLS